MNEDSANPENPPKPPPPSIPPSPPATSPPPQPPHEGSPPPVNVGPPQGTAEGAAPSSPAAAQAVPGADASMGNRVVAAIIDGLIAAALNAVISQLPFMGLIGMLAGIAYLLTRDSLPFLGGQSLGKKAMAIQAVTMDGKSLAGNWQPGLVRNILMAVPFGALVELIVMLTRMDKKPLLRLGDDWAKTKVINAPKSAPVEQSSSAPPPAPASGQREEGGGS